MVARIPKQKKRGVWRQIAVTVLLGIPVLALVAFLAISDYKIFKNHRAVDEQIDKLKQQYEILQERNATLKQGLDQAKQDDFLEERLRDQGYKKPGEEVWAVLGKDDLNKNNTTPDSDNFWFNLWNKIKTIKP